MKNNYELQIKSQLSGFDGIIFKPYIIDGLEHIGVFDAEIFELVFRNNTPEKVQVRLSIDGTDLLTAKEAHTAPTGDGMWVVGPWASMRLKAWPETNQRGRSFVFGQAGASVSKNTHGNMSDQGIIAAAVFTEDHKSNYFYGRKNRRSSERKYWESTKNSIDLKYDMLDIDRERIVEINDSATSDGLYEGPHGSSCREDTPPIAVAGYSPPAVGAGEQIMQKIASAEGLIKPKLNTIVRMKYVWYDDLKAMLLKQRITEEKNHPLGFPGDAKEKKLADLGQTPTTKTEKSTEMHRFV